MKLEAKDTELAEFSMVYAVPCGGKREFRFRNSEDLAQHVSVNRPAIFAGVPYLGEKYEEKMNSLYEQPFRMPDSK